MNFGKSRATNQKKQNVKVRFSDVAGAEERKTRACRSSEFLKDPRKFTALGARILQGYFLSPQELVKPFLPKPLPVKQTYHSSRFQVLNS